MDNKIEQILRKCIDILNPITSSRDEMYELLLSMVFWKYVSDNYKFTLNTEDVYDNAIGKKEDIITTINSVIDSFFKSKNKENGIPALRLTIPINVFTTLYKNLSELFISWVWDKNKVAFLLGKLDELLLEHSRSTHEFITPKDIVSLVCASVDTKEKKTIYDPFCRTGEFFLAMGMHGSTKMINGVANNSWNFKIASIKCTMLGFLKIDITNNILTNTTPKFDLIITNPPFNSRSNQLTTELSGDWLRAFGGIKSEIDFICHSLDHLGKNAQAAIVVPQGLLFSGGRTKDFRQELINRNVLEAVIQLPPNAFYHTRIMTAILVLNSDKNDRNTLLLNGATLGISKKNKREFSESDVAKIAFITDQYRRGHKIFSNAYKHLILDVHPEEFQQNDFSFQFADYDYSVAIENERRLPQELLLNLVQLTDQYNQSQKRMMEMVSNK